MTRWSEIVKRRMHPNHRRSIVILGRIPGSENLGGQLSVFTI